MNRLALGAAVVLLGLVSSLGWYAKRTTAALAQERQTSETLREAYEWADAQRRKIDQALTDHRRRYETLHRRYTIRIAEVGDATDDGCLDRRLPDSITDSLRTGSGTAAMPRGTGAPEPADSDAPAARGGDVSGPGGPGSTNTAGAGSMQQ